MLEELEQAIGIIRETLSVGPEKVPSTDAAKMFEVFVELERAGEAGKMLFARRATEAGAWHEEGYRRPASWLADKFGIGYGDAMRLVETGGHRPLHPGPPKLCGGGRRRRRQ